MSCHYGKDSDELIAWVIAACPSDACTFDTNTCTDAMCSDGKVRTLLATSPVGCNTTFTAAWRALRRTCGREGGVCCPDCVGPLMAPCDKTPRTTHKQVLTFYTATAAIALAALWLPPTPPCPDKRAPIAPRTNAAPVHIGL